ncbi:unnamed protein product [marine sediment metagenome]|uniref:CO dehydrogenase/acetyl-CoA synthase complex beta subunit C-terminal domain-containing protein n=1 Tax=marine sediment metagenome TaxID=412755 RepID=X1QL57_9ZZZZ
MADTETIAAHNFSRVADETIGSTEEEIFPFRQERGHPALTMGPILG